MQQSMEPHIGLIQCLSNHSVGYFLVSVPLGSQLHPACQITYHSCVLNAYPTPALENEAA